MQFVFDREKGLYVRDISTGDVSIVIDNTTFSDYVNREVIGTAQTTLVDATYGNDSTGERETGLAFKTITAALSASISGDTLVVSPGTYDEDIVVPSGVSITSNDSANCIIRRTNVSSSLTLVTLNPGASLQNLTLELSSSQHVDLTGVLFPTGSASTATLIACTVVVDNSRASTSGTSTIIGVLSTGTGSIEDGYYAVQSSVIDVLSIGSGTLCAARAQDSSTLSFTDCSLLSTVPANSTKNAVGVDVISESAIVKCDTTIISGTLFDIEQTSGSIELARSTLTTKTAGNKGFTSDQTSQYIFSDYGVIPVATASFIAVGSSGSSAQENSISITQRILVKDLRVDCVVPVDVASSSSIFVRKNAVETLLTASLSGSQLSSTNEDVSITFDVNDQMSVMIDNVAGSSLAGVTITLTVV